MQVAHQRQRTDPASSGAGKPNRLAANGRRRGNPGSRGAGKPKNAKAATKASADPNAFSASKEVPMGPDDQQRMEVVEQMQQQIVKKGSDVPRASTEEIEQLIHGYISCCHNAAMELMQKQALRAAGRILRQSQEFLTGNVPQYVSDIVVQKGVMHTVFNNLAQHANMTADMNLSIEYLEKALQAAEDPKADQDLLPLAETYLNLANGYSFLENFRSALEYSEKALKFAKLRCNRLRQELEDESNKPAVEQSLKVTDNLSFQLQDFIAIMIMSHVAVGEQHEKLGSYNAAIKFYAEGTHYAETNFGTKHPLYTKCINAMGGARLKSKYQTKEVYRTVDKSGGGGGGAGSSTKPITVKSGSKAGRNKKHSATKEDQHDSHIKSKLMARRLQGGNSLMSQGSRRDIQGAVKKAEVKMSNMMRNHQDNLLLANCDTWTSMHCRHPRPAKRESLVTSMQKRKLSRSSRPTSANSFRLPAKHREAGMQREVLTTMSERRAPYKVVCKVGPSCKNHDWNTRSPLKKVCTRGPNCPNHDWDCSLQKSGSMRSLRSSHKKLNYKMSASMPPQPAIEQTPQALPPIDTQSAYTEQKEEHSVIEVETKSAGGHSCMLNQTERVHQQQMQQMRTMQDEQFKMIQLVLESRNQDNNQSQSQSQSQLNKSYMYYPQQMMNGYGQQHSQQQLQYGSQQYHGQMYPQFYNPGQYPPQYYHPQGHPGTDDDDGNSDHHSDDRSEVTDLSGAQNVNEGRKPNQSELSKAEALETAYQQQQNEMAEMHKRMSMMQHEYQDQLNQMRESTEAAILKAQNKSISQAGRSQDRRPQSEKDYREDLDEVNDRDDELFGNTGHRRSVVMNQSQSRGTLDRDVHVSTSILKPSSTIKSKGQVGYHQSVIEESNKKKSIYSNDSKSRQSPNARSDHSGRNKSFDAQSSFITAKSYRITAQEAKMTREQAAVKIQKIYRGYQGQQDYELMNKRQQKELLIKATINCKILTCSMNVERRQHPVSLVFSIKEMTGRRSNEQFTIDLKSYGIEDKSEMKSKVSCIIKDAIKARDLQEAIIAAFKTETATDILRAEVFTSSDYEIAGKSIARQSSEERLTPVLGNYEHTSTQHINVQEQTTSMINTSGGSEGYVKLTEVEINRQRQREIEAEIERIRQKCDIQYRVDVKNLVVKGHNSKFDDIKVELDDDEERIRGDYSPMNVVKTIMIDQVGVNRKHGKAAGVGADDSDESHHHDYEYVIGSQSNIRKYDSYWLIKIQAMVRGFLARLWNSKNRIIYNKMLTRDGALFKFLLRQNSLVDYTLSATYMRDRRLNAIVDLKEIPFKKHEASDRFEECLIFGFDGTEVTELALTSCAAASENPFVERLTTETDGETHLFITDYKQGTKQGTKKVYDWKVRNTYDCSLYEVITETGIHFRINVEHRYKKDYLELRKLPCDIFYMAYFVDKYLQVNLDGNSELDYISISVLKASSRFLREMEDLEVKFFGCARSDATISKRSLDFSRKSPVDTKRLQTDAPLAQDFIVIRNEIKYVVEVYDDTQTAGRYQINVHRKDNSRDKDWMSVTQITLFFDELKKYLKENLQIYTKIDGTIDYLALTNDSSVINQSNMRKVREHSAAMRINTEHSIRDSSHDGVSHGHTIGDQSSFGYSRSHTLSKCLYEFDIERNNFKYKVEVQERKGVEGRPIQITVTSMNDKKDSEYIVRKTLDRKGQDLVEYLNDHLVVYQKFCEVREKMIIDYVALSSGPLEYQKSNTLSVTQQARPASKKSLVQSRAQKIRNSQEGMLIADKYSDMNRTPKNFSIDNSSFERGINREVSPVQDLQNWIELARQNIQLDSRQAIAILMEKNQPRRSRVPIPRGRTDAEYFKIVLVDAQGEDKIEQVDLTPSACVRLIKLKPSDMSNRQPLMTLSEITRGSASAYDTTQVELLKKWSSFSSNADNWRTILKNVRFVDSENAIKFDVWKICEDKDSLQSSVQNSYDVASPSIQIKAKLLNSNKKEHRINMINSVDMVDNRVDGDDEGPLSDTMSSRNIPVPKYNIIRRKEYAIQQKQFGKPKHGVLSDDNSTINDDESQNKTVKAIVRASSGNYYHMQIHYENEAFYMSLQEKVSRKVIYNKIALPAEFVEDICGESDTDEKLDNLKSELMQMVQQSQHIESMFGNN